MTITFLGTSAATACPLPFCQCKHCEQARVLGGPSLRKRSAALINADLLIDLGPDIIAASFIHGCSITNIRYCLQTHPHSDHLDLSHLLTRSPEYAVEDVPRLGFYASSATLHKAAELLKNECAKASLLDPVFCDHLNMDIHPIEAYQSFVVGPYRVIAFPANHDPTVDPLLYAIEADGQTVFYGTDTAILPEET
jgi:phosphoribosyl 1,2-cyclic phosphate phosphodiesterase